MVKLKVKSVITSLLLGLAVTAPAGVMAQDPSRSENMTPALPDHAYYVVNQPLVQFLEQLERDSDRQIDTTESVHGIVRSARLSGDVEQILTTLSRRFDLEWFGFNGVYYVSAETESRMRLVRLGDMPMGVARDALAQSGLKSDRFPIAEAAQGTALALTGPPKLLGLSEAVIESVVFEPEIAPSRGIVVRRGAQISIESRRLSDIAAQIEAQQNTQASDTSEDAKQPLAEGDS